MLRCLRVAPLTRLRFTPVFFPTFRSAIQIAMIPLPEPVWELSSFLFSSLLYLNLFLFNILYAFAVVVIVADLHCFVLVGVALYESRKKREEKQCR